MGSIYKINVLYHLLVVGCLTLVINSFQSKKLSVFGQTQDYYYTRTRQDPQHLRVSEEFKNNYVDEIKYESKINGTKYEYYKSSPKTMSHDELVFETIDKIFQHRLSPFYVHHYDNDEDKKRSSDAKLVSHEGCAKDLMYLVDKLPKSYSQQTIGRGEPPYNTHTQQQDEDRLTPELTAFFDSYGRHEAGLLMGNTYWVGAYDQCINRHIFELTDSHPAQSSSSSASASSQDTSYSYVNATTSNYKQQQQHNKRVVSFKGRYCVSALKSPTWDSIIKAKQVRSRSYFKTERQFNDYSKLFRLQVGICLPDSCDSTSYERHAEEIKLLTTSMLEQRYAGYELIDLYCLPDESSPLRAWSHSALYFILFITVWSVALLLATLADIFEFVDTLQAIKGERTEWLYRFVTWFSLRANYRKLMKVNQEEEGGGGKKKANSGRKITKTASKPKIQQDGRPSGGDSAEREQETGVSKEQPTHDKEGTNPRAAQVDEQCDQLKINLRFLNAFKALIMFWIVNGHIMLLMIQTAKNILNSDALLNGLMHFLIGATFGVDLFFTMTGFLTSYLIFNSGHAYRMKFTTWIYLSFHRYWRLAPMYLLTFWFSRSVMQLLGSGPLWDYGTSSLTFRGLCNHESWWYPMTLTSNLHGLFEECMITSWYISCDMQFWLVSPIFIYLLAKQPMHGWVVSIATIIMSSKVRHDAILLEQSARYDELVQPRADIFMRVSHDLPALYTHPHYRISAYIVGLLAGHYVYMVKSGKWRSSISFGCPTSKVKQEEKKEEEVEEKTPSDNATTTMNDNENNLIKKEDAEMVKIASLNKQVLVAAGRRRRNILAYTGLLLFLVMSFVSYLLSHYYPTSLLKYAKTVASFAFSLDHLAMSIGASLIIISMCFGQWSKLTNFLSHPHWTRLSKINYALLLLQCEAIYFQIFRYDQVPVAGTRELINILFNLLVTLYPLAFGVTLAFEFPLANIEKLLI